MRTLFSIAYLAVLAGCTLLAMSRWYSRSRVMDAAERAVIARFTLGIAIFWLVALAGYWGGFLSFSD